MGRIFGILFIVLAVWTGVEVYNEGTSGAFGGLFVRLGLAAEDVQRDPIGWVHCKRIVGRVRNRLVDQLATGLKPLAGLVGLAQVEFAHCQD